MQLVTSDIMAILSSAFPKEIRGLQNGLHLSFRPSLCPDPADAITPHPHLLCPPDPWNLPGTALLRSYKIHWIEQYLVNVVLGTNDL